MRCIEALQPLREEREEREEHARVATKLVALILGTVILTAPGVGSSHPEDAPEPDTTDTGVSMKELSQQSANPIGRFAFVFTQFAATFNDGDLDDGDAKIAGDIVFQPIIPIPLIGSDKDEWRIVTRPTINLFARQPLPKRQGGIHRDTGLSDLLIPLPVAFPENLVGNWLLAVGPSFSFPTATDDSFGKEQWTAGASGVLGYIGKDWMAGAYPQYYWRMADQDRDDGVNKASFGNMFYWFFYNITDSWQIGFNPTIQYDHQASSGNKWNVPVGMSFANVTTVYGRSMRIEIGVEYSVLSQDDYGEVARLKINLIPIVGRPIKNAIFDPILGMIFGK